MRTTPSAYRRILHVLLIATFLLSAVPTAELANATSIDNPVASIEKSTLYGSNWNDEIPPSNQPIINLEEQNALLAEPPQESIRLEIDANPAIYLPGKPITLSWVIRGFSTVNASDDLQLEFIPNKGDVLPQLDGIKIQSSDNIFRISLEKPEGEITWNVQPSVTFPIEIEVLLYLNKEVADRSVVQIDQPQFNLEKGQTGSINTSDRKIALEVPADAYTNSLAIDIRSPKEYKQPSYSLSANPIEIVAVDKSTGKNVTNFSKPLSLTVSYDDELYDEVEEKDLMVFYYDESINDWYPIETQVDTKENTLLVEIDHLTVFDYKAATWQGYTLPTIDNFQVSDFTGAATYAVDFNLPPGPAGLQPSLSLTYNSQVIDESYALNQASWVGLGWTLNIGSITRNLHGTNDTVDDTFSLSVNGISAMLLPITSTVYRSSDENFVKVERDASGSPWRVWTKDGAKYEFAFTTKTHTTTICVPVDGNLDVTWQWSLTKIVNIHGQEINISYENENKPSCENDNAVYPTAITYPGQTYKIEFATETRTDYQTTWAATSSKVLYSQKRLKDIQIKYYYQGNWQLVRKYVPSYSNSEANQIYPKFIWSGGGRTLTLIGMQEYASDSTTLPAIIFTYGDKMHLTKVSNGQGGEVEFTYDRFAYFDDDNKDIRSLYIIGGTDECRSGMGSYDFQWQLYQGPGPVRCDGSANMLQVGQDDTGSAKAMRPFQEQLMRPGGRYRLLFNVRSVQGTTTTNFGFVDTTPNPDTILKVYPTGQEPSTGSTYVAYEKSLDLPVTVDPLNTKLYLECSDCRVQRYELVLFPTYYRVSSYKVTDLVTTNNTTYEYTYDNPSPNTATVSKAVKSFIDSGGSLYTPRKREFRGHAMTQVKNSLGLATMNWFYQDDYLKGRTYRTTQMKQDFTDSFSLLDSSGNGILDTTAWTTADGTHTVTYTYGVDFDNSLKSENTAANWNVSATRNDHDNNPATWKLANGEVAVAHFRVEGTTSTQAEVGLVSDSNKFFGLVIKQETGGLAARMRYDSGSGMQDSTVLIPAGQVKLGSWYVATLHVDNDDGFRVRIWQLDAPGVYGEAVRSGFAQENWKYRNRIYSGTLWLDNYADGVLYSETETLYTSTMLYDADSTTTTIPDIGAGSLMGNKDLAVVWSYPTQKISREFQGKSVWLGAKETYSYMQVDQNGAATGCQEGQPLDTYCPQYGNLTRTTYAEWNNSTSEWDNHHATRTQFWPQTSSGKYLVGLPARAIVIDCATSCDFSRGSGLLSEALHIYDGNTGYAAAPTTGRLVKLRTLVLTEGDNRYTETGYGYDTYGNVTGTTTYQGYGTASSSPTTPAITTNRGYDPTYHTYLVSETNALGQTIVTDYDYKYSLPTRVTDPNGAQSGAAYDVFGRMTAVCAPGDWDGITCSPTNTLTLRVEYVNHSSSSAPFRVLMTQKLDETRTMQYVRYYNGLGGILQEQSLNVKVRTNTVTIVVDYQYDTLGRLIKQTKPYTYTGAQAFQTQNFTSRPVTTTTYDVLSRVTSVSEPNNTSVTTDYGQLSVTSTDANGNPTIYLYNPWGLVTNVDAVTGPDLSYTYDELGRLVTATKGVGGSATTTTIQYDVAGRKKNMIDPDMGVWAYAYDALGNLIRQTDTLSQTTCLYYDALNRLTGKYYTGTQECPTLPAMDVRYGYDEFAMGIGRRTSMNDDSGSTEWTYDARGRILSEEKTIDEVAYETGWEYNSADLPVSMTYPDGEVVDIDYDTNGNLTSILDSSGSPYVFSILYDEVGRFDTLFLGLSSHPIVYPPYVGYSGRLSIKYSYYGWTTSQDGGHLQKRETSRIPDGQPRPREFDQVEYYYDNNGNIDRISDFYNDEESLCIRSDGIYPFVNKR